MKVSGGTTVEDGAQGEIAAPPAAAAAPNSAPPSAVRKVDASVGVTMPSPVQAAPDAVGATEAPGGTASSVADSLEAAMSGTQQRPTAKTAAKPAPVPVSKPIAGKAPAGMVSTVQLYSAGEAAPPRQESRPDLVVTFGKTPQSVSETAAASAQAAAPVVALASPILKDPFADESAEEAAAPARRQQAAPPADSVAARAATFADNIDKPLSAEQLQQLGGDAGSSSDSDASALIASNSQVVRGSSSDAVSNSQAFPNLQTSQPPLRDPFADDGPEAAALFQRRVEVAKASSGPAQRRVVAERSVTAALPAGHEAVLAGGPLSALASEFGVSAESDVVEPPPARVSADSASREMEALLGVDRSTMPSASPSESSSAGSQKLAVPAVKKAAAAPFVAPFGPALIQKSSSLQGGVPHVVGAEEVGAEEAPSLKTAQKKQDSLSLLDQMVGLSQSMAAGGDKSAVSRPVASAKPSAKPSAGDEMDAMLGFSFVQLSSESVDTALVEVSGKQTVKAEVSSKAEVSLKRQLASQFLENASKALVEVSQVSQVSQASQAGQAQKGGLSEKGRSGNLRVAKALRALARHVDLTHDILRKVTECSEAEIERRERAREAEIRRKEELAREAEAAAKDGSKANLRKLWDICF